MRRIIAVSLFAMVSIIVPAQAFLITDCPYLLRISTHQEIYTTNDTIKLSAAIYDRNNVPVRIDSKDDTCFTWSVINNDHRIKSPLFIDSTGADCAFVISDTTALWFKVGCKLVYMSRVAFDTTDIVFIPHMNEYNIFIEKDSSLMISPNKPAPVCSITVLSSDTIHLFAIMRDYFGNYVKLGNHCNWIASSDIIKIKTKDNCSGEACIIPAVQVGQCTMYCSDSSGVTSNIVSVRINIELPLKSLQPEGFVIGNINNDNFYTFCGRMVKGKRANGAYITVDASNRKNRIHLNIKPFCKP